MTKTWCVGGGHYSESENQNVFEKVNTETKNLLNFSRELVVIVEELKIKFSLSKLDEEKILKKKNM